MTDETCGTCGFWEANNNLKFGQCKNWAVRVDIERVEHSHIEFAETFGCIHHEPREKDDGSGD